MTGPAELGITVRDITGGKRMTKEEIARVTPAPERPPLRPAIRLEDGSVIQGKHGETHADVIGNSGQWDTEQGFVDDAGNWLSRVDAEEYMMDWLGGRINVGEELHSDLVARIGEDPQRYRNAAIPRSPYPDGLDAADMYKRVEDAGVNVPEVPWGEMERRKYPYMFKGDNRIVVHGSHPERKVVVTAELNDGTIIVDTDVSSHLDLVEAHGIPYENVKRLGVRRNGKYEWDSEAPQIDDEGYIHSSEAFDEDQAKTAMREDLEREGKLPNPLEQRIKEKRAKKPKKEE